MALRRSARLTKDVVSETHQPSTSQASALDVNDEVIRSLNDEYKKIKLTSPLESFEGNWVTKSKENSVNYCDKADSMAKERQYAKSLSLYAGSIAFAEDESEELALAYSKRSIALEHLQLYDQCMEDIDRALVGITSSRVRTKLEKRKELCVERRKKDVNKRSVLMLRPAINSPYKTVRKDQIVIPATSEQKWNAMCQFNNPRIANVSAKIELRYDEQKRGRYLEARQNLKAGEVIACQNVFTIFSERRSLMYQRCSYCIKLCAALIPCSMCSLDMYCSEKCREEAFESYHRLECKILVSSGKQINEMEFRMIRLLLIGTQQGAKLGNMMKRLTVHKIMATDSPVDKKFVDDYETMLRLDPSYSRDLLKRSVPSVAKLITILERVGFFEVNPSFYTDAKNQDTLTKVKIFVAFLLLNNTVGVEMYEFSTQVMDVMQEGLADVDVISIGHFTPVPAFNHSCDPNTFFIWRNRKLAVLSSRPIAKGEKITVSYGPSYMDHNKISRQAELYQNFGYTCECVVCLNDWPTKEVLSTRALEFHDHIKRTKAIRDLKRMVCPVVDIKSSLESLKPKDIFQIALDLGTWLSENIKRPSFDHAQVEDLVFFCAVLLYDNLAGTSPSVDVKDFARTTSLQLLRRLGVDIASITSNRRRSTRKRNTLKVGGTGYVLSTFV